MRLLIDTHALIWFCEGNPALSVNARAAMEDDANERFISHATPWEVAIKSALGKLELQVGYDVFFPGVLTANGFELLPSTMDHYRELVPLPRHHGDPFDRLMIAQARVEQLTIITCDPHFPSCGVPLLWQASFAAMPTRARTGIFDNEAAAVALAACGGSTQCARRDTIA